MDFKESLLDELDNKYFLMLNGETTVSFSKEHIYDCNEFVEKEQQYLNRLHKELVSYNNAIEKIKEKQKNSDNEVESEKLSSKAVAFIKHILKKFFEILMVLGLVALSVLSAIDIFSNTELYSLKINYGWAVTGWVIFTLVAVTISVISFIRIFSYENSFRCRWAFFTDIKKAELGNMLEQYEVARDYELGFGVRKNTKKAFEWYRRAAKQGHSDAQYRLSLCYYYATGVKQDFEEAVKWCRKAAEQGHAEAAYDLGRYYGDGIGVEQDLDEAAKWFLEAAYAGFGGAIVKLRLLNYYTYDDFFDEFYDGFYKGVHEYFSNILNLYIRLAEKNDVIAQYNLGKCYQDGRYVGYEYDMAVKWYRKAAEQGYAPAQYELANAYYDGIGVDQNHKEALKWYYKASEQDHIYAKKKAQQLISAQTLFGLNNCSPHRPDSQCALAKRYYDGVGTDKNEAEAFKWYSKAAEQGYAEAQCGLAKCYNYGKGTNIDATKALKYYLKAAEQGYAEAQHGLAICYEYGRGTNKNEAEAFKWHSKAAEQGYVYSQIAVGMYYDNGGGGVKQNSEMAYTWYKKAAEQGNCDAQLFVGDCYYHGKGTVQNYSSSIEWYRKAADQGEHEAQYKLGCYYHKVIHDSTKAVKWYLKASKAFNDEVQIELKSMGIQLNPWADRIISEYTICENIN